MLDSLLELIAGVFIAAVPILLAISRARRRRTGEPEKRTGLFRRAVDRLRGRSGARAGNKPDRGPAERPVPEGAAREGQGPRQGPHGEGSQQRGGDYRRSRGTESVFDPEPEEQKIAPSRGAERLLERVDRYPPLQRAIVLKEILDQPKGLDWDSVR